MLDTPIPLKGEVLSRLANWWFEKTADLVPNHVLRAVDPVATLVREVEPIRIEMVVRGYLTGSMGRAYAAGARTFCGAAVPDGLAPNARFPQPLVTPTTKEKNDREITPPKSFRRAGPRPNAMRRCGRSPCGCSSAARAFWPKRA